jgi:hypothetical protein
MTFVSKRYLVAELLSEDEMLRINISHANKNKRLHWQTGEPKFSYPWQEVESIQVDGDELSSIVRRFPNINQYTGSDVTTYVADDAKVIYVNMFYDQSSDNSVA